MAESIRTHQKSYIPAFLQRHANKKGKHSKRTKDSRVSELSEIDEVSQSKDVLLSVTPGVTPSPEATLRTHILTDRHTREPFHGKSNLVSASEVRRRYSDNVIKDTTSEIFDCHDYLSDRNMTSSSNETSPTRHPNEIRKDSAGTREQDLDVFHKRHSSSSLAMSSGLPGCMDSLNSDIDEHGSYILDVDTSKSGKADEDTSSLSNRPAVTVQTCPIQISDSLAGTVITNDNEFKLEETFTTHVMQFLANHIYNIKEEPSSPTSGHQVSPQHSLFMLNILLQEGRELVVRDSCGTSDPYVKFKMGNKVLYKSRTIFKNLNPRWDEQFSIPVDDVTKPLIIKVFDYDRTWNDDPMGGADLDLTALEMNKTTELKLPLSEKDKEEYMGYLLLTCTLVPKSDESNKEQDRSSKTSVSTSVPKDS